MAVASSILYERSYRCSDERADDVARYLRQHPYVAADSVKVVHDVVHYRLDDTAVTSKETNAADGVVRNGCDAVVAVREWT